jgi:hypothetical protein
VFRHAGSFAAGRTRTTPECPRHSWPYWEHHEHAVSSRPGFFRCRDRGQPEARGWTADLQTPPKARPGFVKNLYREYLTFTDVKAPFNRVICFSLKAMPHWEPAASIDLAQHIFYHRLPRGGNDRQALYDFVARLHVPMLDRSRPLWALHVIDGLDGGGSRCTRRCTTPTPMA